MSSSIDAAAKEVMANAQQAAAEAAAKAKEEAAAREAEAKKQALTLETARARAIAAVFEQERAALEALERAAREDEEPLHMPPLPPSSIEEDYAAFVEVSTIANLHAEASGVQNIRTLVPIMLDPLSTHFNKWRGHMLLTLRRYALSNHVLDNTSYPTVPSWFHIESVVVSWIFNTITSELIEIVDDRRGMTVRAVWLGIEHQFLGNSEIHALYLDAEFRSFVQGDLSITDDYHRIRSMAAALADLGEAISDWTLVLNIVHGLSISRVSGVGSSDKNPCPRTTMWSPIFV